MTSPLALFFVISNFVGKWLMHLFAGTFVAIIARDIVCVGWILQMCTFLCGIFVSGCLSKIIHVDITYNIARMIGRLLMIILRATGMDQIVTWLSPIVSFPSLLRNLALWFVQCFSESIAEHGRERNMCSACNEEKPMWSWSEHECTAAAQFCKSCYVNAVKANIEENLLPVQCPGCRQHPLGSEALSQLLDADSKELLTVAAKKQVKASVLQVTRIATLYPCVGSLGEFYSQLQESMQFCQGCGHAVEKNEGCNHMTCLGHCGRQWCWPCGAASTWPCPNHTS